MLRLCLWLDISDAKLDTVFSDASAKIVEEDIDKYRQDAQYLIRACLQGDPERRPTMEELKDFSFLKERGEAGPTSLRRLMSHDVSELRGAYEIRLGLLMAHAPTTPREHALLQQSIVTLPSKIDASQSVSVLKRDKRRARYHIFISHAQKEASGDAGTLFFLFEQMGVNVWRDMNQTDLTSEGMRRGVYDSDIFILFLTNNYLSRPFCLKEITYALEFGKPIIIIREEEERFWPFNLERWKTDRCTRAMNGEWVLSKRPLAAAAPMVFFSLRFDGPGDAQKEAKQVRSALKALGIRVMPSADPSLVDDRQKEIFDSIKECKVFVVFGAPQYGEATGNPMCSYHECTYANKKKKTFAVINMRDDPDLLDIDEAAIETILDGKIWKRWSEGVPAIVEFIVGKIPGYSVTSSVGSAAASTVATGKGFQTYEMCPDPIRDLIEERAADGSMMPFRRRDFEVNALTREIVRRASTHPDIAWGSQLPPPPALTRIDPFMERQIFIFALETDYTVAVMDECKASIDAATMSTIWVDDIDHANHILMLLSKGCVDAGTQSAELLEKAATLDKSITFLYVTRKEDEAWDFGEFYALHEREQSVATDSVSAHEALKYRDKASEAMHYEHDAMILELLKRMPVALLL